MKESATYQAILGEGEAKGRAEGEAQGELKGRRDALIDAASDKLGPPDAATRAALQAVTDLSRLAAMNAHVWRVASWAELLAIAP